MAKVQRLQSELAEGGAADIHEHYDTLCNIVAWCNFVARGGLFALLGFEHGLNVETYVHLEGRSFAVGPVGSLCLFAPTHGSRIL